jgi:hypothetical protein
MSAASVSPQDKIRRYLTQIDAIMTSSVTSPPDNQMELVDNDTKIASHYTAIAEIASTQAKNHMKASGNYNSNINMGGGRRRTRRHRRRRHSRRN